MAVSHTFRSALNGFNRSDVVHYIEYLNGKNASTVNQLMSENQALKDELASLKAKLNAAPCNYTAPAEQSEPEAKNITEEELEAYRRAERMERLAKERSDQIYRQAAAALADASTQVDDAAEQFKDIADRVSDQINLLKNAVEDSKNALRSAAATMYTIRPEDTEE